MPLHPSSFRWLVPIAAIAAIAISVEMPSAQTAPTTLTIELPDFTALQRGNAACSRSSILEANACQIGAMADYLIALGACLHVTDRAEAAACAAAAADARGEAQATCAAQAEGRIAVCARLGEAAYDPDIDPADFVDPRTIGSTVEPNPYLPLIAGTVWTYASTYRDEDGEVVTERNVVTVTDRLKLIDGVLAVVVSDVVYRDGELHEDTDDWYAQDRDGNVWYFGEEVKNYEVFEGDIPERPELVDMHGAWKAGDTIRPGIIMHAEPAVGLTYRQEFVIGGPQDLAEILAVDATEAVPAATCDRNCLVTREWTPVEPDVVANKYYAPGIGLILEIEEGVRIELVEFVRP